MRLRFIPLLLLSLVIFELYVLFLASKSLGSLKVLANIVDAFELGIFPKIKVFGEPHLGKRDLYPTTSKNYVGEHPAKTRMNIIAYCDSNHNLFEIAKKVNVNLEKVMEEVKILNKKGLIDL